MEGCERGSGEHKVWQIKKVRVRDRDRWNSQAVAKTEGWNDEEREKVGEEERA